MSRVTSGFGQSSRATPGRPLRPFFVVDAFAALAFCPLDGGSDELVGVFGGLPARASSSATRARSSYILVSSESTSAFRLSASSESIPSGGIPSLNQTDPTHSTPNR